MNTTSTPASLVDLAQLKRLPRHQHMDRATIEWIEAHRPTLEPGYLPPLRLATKQILVRSAFPVTWTAEPRLHDSLHGVRHGMRVAALAALLTETHGLDDVDAETTILAAAVHDCRRLHDQGDQGHGLRAAAWLAASADTVWFHFGRVATPHQITRASTAIRLHDVPYEDFGEDEQTAYHNAERICDLVKAADALDRFRLPKLSWWPDARQVREPTLERFFRIAFDLVVVSETAHLAGTSSAEAALQAFAATGLV